VAVSLLKTYQPGLRVTLTPCCFWPSNVRPFGRVVVCLHKAPAYALPMCVRWDDGAESHEGHDIAPVSDIHR
jgi:hypothetical protein